MSNLFQTLGADLESLFAQVSVPTELQPQVDAIKSTVQQAAASVETQVVQAAAPAVSTEATIVLNHNHLSSLVPMVQGLISVVADWYAAGHSATPAA